MPKTGISDFHLVNIHERTWLATFSRSMPLLIIVVWMTLVLLGFALSNQLMLFMSAFANVAVWLMVCSKCCFCYYGIWKSSKVRERLEAAPEADGYNVVHLCIIPNYKEDEDMLAKTLRCLEECSGSRHFRVVLAMEVREGEPGRLKGERLRKRFAGKFAHISVSYHPGDLMERHLDGSCDDEVPGKASNLKWAVRVASEECEQAGIRAVDVLVTVLDADCLFHPGYFSYIGNSHHELKEECKMLSNEDYLWRGYQAPQVCFSNYYEAPAPSRTWAYISMVFELGGVSSLDSGGQHMCFSSYTLPLQLLLRAGLWSGDVVAEDHHIYLKCLFYSMRSQLLQGADVHPLLELQSVPLPVKSTSVISEEGWWESCEERFSQAKRHAQGVTEFEYAVLAILTMAPNLPLSCHSFFIVWKTFKALMRLCSMHFLPMLQPLTLAVVTIDWLWYNTQIPECPDRIWLANFQAPQFYLCGLAGAWALAWPLLVPMALVTIASVLVVWFWFIVPGRKANRIVWEEEDSKMQPLWDSKLLRLICLTLVDCFILTMPIMFFYGMIPMFYAIIMSLYRGNRIVYITASKAASTNNHNGKKA